MRKIQFLTDFATKKKGDTWECDNQLASQLVHIEKVATYTDASAEEVEAAANAAAEATAKWEAEQAEKEIADAPPAEEAPAEEAKPAKPAKPKTGKK